MVPITIPLMAGRNYISFSAISSDNFGTIFTGIKANIIKFFTYDPVSGWTDVSDFEYIDEGRGYILDMATPGNIITYDGIEYALTFNQLKSRLIEGLNLVGPGYVPIIPPNWCRVLNADTNFPVTQLEPNKSYLIYYNDCIKPTVGVESVLGVIGAIGTILFTIYLLREFRIIGKPIKD